ncbi:protein-disulfide reductase DsbD [Aliidiomarina soli]|nr:protein-disulfide reductase DsbD [Aliidiomarina soli]
MYSILRTLFKQAGMALLALVTLSMSVAHAQAFDINQYASNDSDFLPVDQAFAFDFEQQGDELTLYFEIADGYYLYQHRFSYQPEGLIYGVQPLPTADEHHDEFFGETFIYRNRLAITLELAPIRENTSLTVTYQGCADAGLCYAPTSKEIPLQPTSGASSGSSATPLTDFSEPASGPFSDLLSSDNLVWVMAVFVLLGLGLAFTPCVFPMYPIIVGIIGGQKGKLSTRRGFMLSFVYVQGMALTYTTLGVIVALAGMQYQAMLQHPAVLLTLAVLFVVLAAGMFGAFNMQLPASWQAKLNSISQQQKGGAYGGVFAMGALSGLVASPCTTAPLSGVLLFIAQSGDVVNGALILYALSIGMGLPLILIGTSGGKLLPKAGAWMNSVKIVFGLLLLAVALFLIERLLPMVLAGVIWLIFIAASLLIIARSFWPQLKTRGRLVLSAILIVIAAAGAIWQKPFIQSAFIEHLEFEPVTSLEALQTRVSAAEGQWVMLDLYADWCVACKEFEVYTFTDPGVQAQLEDVVVLQADVTATNATNTQLLSEYQVVGLPTILFFDPAGNEIQNARVTGFMNASEFQKHLESLMNKEN